MNNCKLRISFLASVVVCLLTFCPTTSAQGREVFGWVEKISIHPGDIVLHAKLDTGADSCSLDVAHFEEFKRDGAKWVKFDVTNRYGKHVVIEKEIRRVALVKRHSGSPQKRNVIRMGICLGDKYMETDMTLVNRRNFDYQVLIGRAFLSGNALVDSAVSYTADPVCKVDHLREVKPLKIVKDKDKDGDKSKIPPEDSNKKLKIKKEETVKPIEALPQASEQSSSVGGAASSGKSKEQPKVSRENL